MITYEIKRRVPLEVKDHFIDEWGTLVDPAKLASKLDEYKVVRKIPRKTNYPQNFDKNKGNPSESKS